MNDFITPWVSIATVIGAAAAALQLLAQQLISAGQRRRTSHAIQDYASLMATAQVLPAHSQERQTLIDYANLGPLRRIKVARKRAEAPYKKKLLSTILFSFLPLLIFVVSIIIMTYQFFLTIVKSIAEITDPPWTMVAYVIFAGLALTAFSMIIRFVMDLINHLQKVRPDVEYHI